MRAQITFYLLTALLLSCNKTENKQIIRNGKTATDSDSIVPAVKAAPVTYSNVRFRNVTVDKISDRKFRIFGEGQIFEASFSWVIEDGHNELQKGFEMTDAGAPEWGKFDFTIDAPQKRDNSTLTLVLFEISAKDGSRQHELPIPLN